MIVQDFYNQTMMVFDLIEQEATRLGLDMTAGDR